MKIIHAKPDSLIEWPGHISYVIFVAGCNFQCPWCYVPDLVLKKRHNKMKSMDPREVLKQIRERKRLIDAVCITGGEPTIHDSELYDLIFQIKETRPDVKVRLETNGSNPELLEKLIRQHLVDSVALDIKNSRQKYAETVGGEVDIAKINETISLIKSFERDGLDYEFRTTLVPGLHEKQDIIDIAEWIYNVSPSQKQIKLYVLQQFRADLPHEATLNPEFIKRGNYLYKKLEEIKEELKKLRYFNKIEIRGEE